MTKRLEDLMPDNSVPGTNRRGFLGTAGVTAAGFAAACAPGAAPPDPGASEDAGTASGWEA